MENLPTPEQMLDRAEHQLDKAYAALGDADDELRSDWPPGHTMTTAQVRRQQRMQTAISKAKAQIIGGKQR